MHSGWPGSCHSTPLNSTLSFTPLDSSVCPPQSDNSARPPPATRQHGFPASRSAPPPCGSGRGRTRWDETGRDGAVGRGAIGGCITQDYSDCWPVVGQCSPDSFTAVLRSATAGDPLSRCCRLQSRFTVPACPAAARTARTGRLHHPAMQCCSVPAPSCSAAPTLRLPRLTSAQERYLTPTAVVWTPERAPQHPPPPGRPRYWSPSRGRCGGQGGAGRSASGVEWGGHSLAEAACGAPQLRHS